MFLVVFGNIFFRHVSVCLFESNECNERSARTHRFKRLNEYNNPVLTWSLLLLFRSLRHFTFFLSFNWHSLWWKSSPLYRNDVLAIGENRIARHTNTPSHIRLSAATKWAFFIRFLFMPSFGCCSFRLRALKRCCIVQVVWMWMNVAFTSLNEQKEKQNRNLFFTSIFRFDDFKKYCVARQVKGSNNNIDIWKFRISIFTCRFPLILRVHVYRFFFFRWWSDMRNWAFRRQCVCVCACIWSHFTNKTISSLEN